MHFRQVTALHDPIKAITCWLPDAGLVILLIWLGSLLQQGLHMGMIIKNAVKWSVHSIIHIIHEGLLIFIVRAGLLLLPFWVGANDVDCECENWVSYLPGSAMILTPESDGKYLSRARLITLMISSNLSFVSSDPRKLPPISSRYMLKPTSVPMSNTQRASDTACTKVYRSVHPLPTWKLTPMTSIFSSFARSKRSLLVLSVASDLTPSQQTALQSSVTVHKTNFVFRCALTTFINSISLSKVIWTRLLAAYSICETCLQGFA